MDGRQVGAGRGRGGLLNVQVGDSSSGEEEEDTIPAPSVVSTPAPGGYGQVIPDPLPVPPYEELALRYQQLLSGDGEPPKESPPAGPGRAMLVGDDDEEEEVVTYAGRGRGRAIKSALDVRPTSGRGRGAVAALAREVSVGLEVRVPEEPEHFVELEVDAPEETVVQEQQEVEELPAVVEQVVVGGHESTPTTRSESARPESVLSQAPAGSAGGSRAVTNVFPALGDVLSERSASLDPALNRRLEQSVLQPVTVSPTPTGPPRVKVVRQGVKGDSVPLATNFVRLNYVNKGKIYEYHVEFDPPLDSTKMKKKKMKQLMEDAGLTYTFDGTMLFLCEKMNGDTLKFPTQHPNKEEPMMVSAAFVKEKVPHELIQFFNILFKQIMGVLNRVQLRRNYYDISNVKSLVQHRLDVWPGYCIAVEEQEGGLMICLDASHRVLRRDTVFEQYSTMKGAGSGWKEKFTDFIIGKIVLTRYNNLCYKIDDIWWDSNPTDTFPKRGKEVSYMDYYHEQHAVQIVHKEQPMLVSRIKPRRGDVIQEDKIVALVPELCFITGLTDEQRANFTIMKDLGEHTRLTPAQRKIALERFIKDINRNPDAKQVLTKWNLELENATMQLDARVHAGPKLSFGKREVNVQADFSKDALSGVVNPQRVDKYLLICTQRDSDKAKRFAEAYQRVCQQLGIPTLGTPTIFQMKGFQVNDFRRAIKDNLTDEFQFLFCLMPQQRDDVYSLVKKLCIAELEVPSQCCLTKTLSNEKKFNSVVQKIALQINCKLGGALWALKIPFERPIMFVGIDVAHDPKKKSPSVLGLVATLNNECTKYVSLCRILKVHQETADSLCSAFIDALETYNQVQGTYPDRVIVWRDGGMADPSSFNQHEVQQVKKAMSDRCSPGTKFSFVVVQKRIPQRFFKTDRLGRNWENPAPGTVVDHTVTQYDAYDFYVVSQLVRQGTVSPTHYTVISDEGDSKPDLLQKFAYVCSFMYYNWPGTVRVPAMTQYAHKLAGLVANNVRADPGKTLRDTLYYL